MINTIISLVIIFLLGLVVAYPISKILVKRKMKKITENIPVDVIKEVKESNEQRQRQKEEYKRYYNSVDENNR